MKNPIFTAYDDDYDDYDDGSENSGKSRDRDMEPGDPGWLSDDDDWLKDL